MSLAQQKPIAPPQEQDKSLEAYSQVIQNNLSTLFQAGHTHNVLTAAPTSTQGAPGDILLALVSGSAYIYIKISKTAWYRFGPGTAV